MGRLIAGARALAVALLLLGALPGHVAGADVVFGAPAATSTFLQGIRFTQPVTLGEAVDRVELLLTFPGSSGPFVVEVDPPGTTGPTTLTYTWDTSGSDALAPNTTVTARWRVRPVGAQGPLPPGPPVSASYADTRYHWQTAEQGVVRVHWYQGDAAFGRRALATAKDAISRAETALGVTESAPIDFFVYADRAAFRDAIGASTGEFTVGRAIPEIRTLFGLIQPGDSGAGADVTIAHELTHIVFDTATRNPYHAPPSWLNEGIAYYLSEGYTAEYRQLVSNAAADGSLYRLVGLVQVDLPGEKTFLGVAEQDAAIDYLIRTYGRPALAKLVDSYTSGRTDDEAFRSAIGKDEAGFEADWFASIGAKVPTALGPSPAPAGPVPPGWGSGAAVASPESARPAATGDGRPANEVAGRSDAMPTLLGLGAVALAGVLGLAVIVRSRRRPPTAIAGSGPGGDDRPTGAEPVGSSWPGAPGDAPPVRSSWHSVPGDASPIGPAWPSGGGGGSSEGSPSLPGVPGEGSSAGPSWPTGPERPGPRGDEGPAPP